MFQTFTLPIAVFCRHAGGKLFETVPADTKESLAEKPMQLWTELMESERLTRDLSQFNASYNIELPPKVKALFERETSRQSALRGALDNWIDPKDDL
jgi:hypothetical protein